MVENDHRFFLASLGRIHRRTVHSVAARRIAAVGPVHRPVGKIEFQINRFGQALVEKFDVFAIGGALTFGNFEIGAEDSSFAGIVGTFLGPIKFSTFDVEGNSDTPFLYDLPRTCVAFAGVDKCLDVGTIQVGTHDPHAFAIAPIKLPVLLIELQLLGSEGAARRNNVGKISSVKIGTLDRAIVGGGNAHVGPVEVSSGSVHNNAIWQSL